MALPAFGLAPYLARLTIEAEPRGRGRGLSSDKAASGSRVRVQPLPIACRHGRRPHRTCREGHEPGAARRPEPSTFGAAKAEGARPKKGMQLGKAKKANDFLDSLRAEGEVVEARPWPRDK